MFTEAISWAVSTLTAAGVKACADPADLNTPGVWVAPVTAAWDTQDDAQAIVTLNLYLVARSAGTVRELAALDTLAAQVRAAGINVRDLEAVQLALPNHNPAGLPAYRATVALRVEE